MPWRRRIQYRTFIMKDFVNKQSNSMRPHSNSHWGSNYLAVLWMAKCDGYVRSRLVRLCAAPRRRDTERAGLKKGSCAREPLQYGNIESPCDKHGHTALCTAKMHLPKSHEL